MMKPCHKRISVNWVGETEIRLRLKPMGIKSHGVHWDLSHCAIGSQMMDAGLSPLLYTSSVRLPSP